MVEIERVFEDDRAVIARCRNLALVGWREAPAAEHIGEWHRLGKTMAREHGERTACVDIVLRGTPRFTEDVRTAAEGLARDPKVFSSGIAHAILVPGLAGTAVRTFIQTILLVSRPVTPVKVVADVESGVKWIAPRLALDGWPESDAWRESDVRAACGALVELSRAAPSRTSR